MLNNMDVLHSYLTFQVFLIMSNTDVCIVTALYIDCKSLYKKRDVNKSNFYFEHYIDDLSKMSAKKRIDYAMDLLSKYKYAKKIYSARLHAYLPCRAMGLNVVYVGDMNYRVKDLINSIPNKQSLKEQFYNYVNNKSNM